ncbi:hypothetical protein JK172_12375 [Acetobacter thailandicus]|nr:hypothetical protein [Acetobacter thailandicus]
MSSKNRSMPSLHSDEVAEDFVATADLEGSKNRWLMRLVRDFRLLAI